MHSVHHSKIDAAVRQRLAEYLSSASTLEEFSNWFLSVCWDYQLESDDVLGRVESILSEHSSGFGGEAEVKQLLGQLLASPAARR